MIECLPISKIYRYLGSYNGWDSHILGEIGLRAEFCQLHNLI